MSKKNTYKRSAESQKKNSIRTMLRQSKLAGNEDATRRYTIQLYTMKKEALEKQLRDVENVLTEAMKS